MVVGVLFRILLLSSMKVIVLSCVIVKIMKDLYKYIMATDNMAMIKKQEIKSVP